MLLVASGYNSLSWWPTPQNHAGWSPPPCQIFNKLTPCWNKPLHHIIMTNLRHGADAVRDTHPLSCLLYLTKSSSSSNLSELRNKILVTGLCSVSRWVITAKTFRGKKDRRRRLFISSPVPIHFTWKLRQKTGQPATKRRPKPIREWKKTSVKLSFISSRWSRMVVSHRLSTLLPGLPACFSLKQGVTHTHTKSVNIQLLNLPVEQTQPPNSTGFLFKLTCNVVEKGGVTPAPAACSLAYCSAAVTAVKVHRGLALASLASPANSHSRPASVSRSPFSTQS